jgi:dimethylaniline monooxygenase (N-oxide forming)
MKVAVVGAGPSGLVAIKELLEEGHDVVCFERAPDIGGVFRFDPDGPGIWESCRLTSSSLTTTYSDFPPPPDTALHYDHAQYLAYLRAYCAHFDLLGHIRLRHCVEHVARGASGKWQLDVDDGSERTQHAFDAVAICSGLHQSAFEPEIDGRELFAGDVRHASLYKNAEAYRGKRVVVVGAGESGADIAAEVAAVTADCVLSIRQAPFVFPRLIRGLPNDYYTTRLRHSLPAWVERVRNPEREVRPLRLLLGFLTAPLSVPVWLFDRLEKGAENLSANLRVKYDVPAAINRTIDALREKSGGGFAEQFATKSEAFVYALLDDRCSLKPALTALTRDAARFRDGTTFDADAVILCTGFRSSFPFLNLDVSDSRTLFKNTFHIETGPSLALIGLVRPAVGNIPVIAEAQARWFALLCSGKRELPSQESMRAESERDAGLHRQTFRWHSDRLPQLVDFTSFMDDIAARIGCKPSARALWRRPALMRAVYTGPFTAHQYRLRGPHAKPQQVMPTLERLQRSQPLRTIALQLFRHAVCRVLAGVGFDRFRAHLTLAGDGWGADHSAQDGRV